MAHIIITTDEPRSLTMLPHQTNQWHLFILFTFIWYFFYYGRIGSIFTMIVELSEKKHYVHIVYLNCSLFTDKIIFFFTFYPYSTFSHSRLMKLINKTCIQWVSYQHNGVQNLKNMSKLQQNDFENLWGMKYICT